MSQPNTEPGRTRGKVEPLVVFNQFYSLRWKEGHENNVLYTFLPNELHQCQLYLPPTTYKEQTQLQGTFQEGI